MHFDISISKTGKYVLLHFFCLFLSTALMAGTTISDNTVASDSPELTTTTTAGLDFTCVNPYCPPDYEVDCLEDAAPDFNNPTYIPHFEADCEIFLDYTEDVDNNPSDPALAAIITRNWTVSNSNGDEFYCTQIVKVTAGQEPTVTAPADITIACGASTDPADTGMATATDANGSVPVSYSDEIVGDPEDDCSTIIRTWTASNECGEGQDVQIITRTPPPPFENECYSLAACMDYDSEAGTTRFTWELCLIGDDCKDISNIRFSIPCDLPKSALLESSSSMSGLKVEINGRTGNCERYDVQFEGFGDGAMKREPNQCVTFSYLIDADLREYVTDVAIKAGNQQGLDFPGISLDGCNVERTSTATQVPSAENFGNGKGKKSLVQSSGNVTGLEEVAVFPNPARDLITLQFASEDNQRVDLQIYDATGRVAFRRVVEAATGTNTVELSLGDIPAGLYQMVVTPEMGDRTVRSFLRLR
ncbi:T9SS type A sorting domain-containing protein [Neolewinella litorea]|nr:T9SS type A sorting domain-containing protein [Neolewinella litorea]